MRPCFLVCASTINDIHVVFIQKKVVSRKQYLTAQEVKNVQYWILGRKIVYKSRGA